MRNLHLVLQNAGGGTKSSSPRVEVPPRELTPQETDALLSESLWSRPVRRVLTEFQDNYSGDFRLFRIY
jgi:hypothetical protein